MIDKIPPWTLRFTLLVSLPIAAAALYLTRTYAVGNLAVLGLDADTVFVRRLSIDVLLAAHVAAFFLVALLPDEAFRFKRWQLYTLAFCIWAFDGAAIYQARFGVMDSANSVQVTAVTRLADQRAAIKGLQEQAAAMRVTSARQLANKMITKGAESQVEAARLEADAAAMTKQLATMPSGAGTTEVKTWGWLAPYKAATESALISFVSLIMLGLAGLTLRELLQQAAAARPAPVTSKPAAPAPAVVPTAPEWVQAPVTRAPAPKVSYNVPSALLKALGFGFAAAGAAGAAGAATPAAAPAQSTPARPAPTPAAAPSVPAPAIPEQVYPVTPEQVQQQVQAAPQRVRKVRVRKTPPPAGARHDTGVSGDAAGRYTRLQAAVRAGRCTPSLNKVREFLSAAGEGCNQDVAIKYLAQLAAEGVIEKHPSGRGWKVKVAA